ncbi:MAG: F0F1 ATP synthase subunit delta, partial [Minisyncoccales bacterium]
PSKEFIEKISNKIEKEVGEKVILNLIINHKITGGIIIEYRGKYLDLSLSKKINKSIAQKVYE